MVRFNFHVSTLSYGPLLSDGELIRMQARCVSGPGSGAYMKAPNAQEQNVMVHMGTHGE